MRFWGIRGIGLGVLSAGFDVGGKSRLLIFSFLLWVFFVG
jgi:hypothetical protein